jgi:ABC-2 type transport system permease protein
VINVVADSFAGERERQTLETLLATRLSDRAILLGKLCAALGYGWGLTMLSLVLGVVTVNLAHGEGALLMYPANVAMGTVLLSLLSSGLAAGAGVLVSLRASTVRQAQQSLGLVVTLLIFVPIFGVQALPAEWQSRLADWLTDVDITRAVLVVGSLLLALDVVMLAANLVRFQRDRLILD